jgi:hypothetical protein
LATPENYFTKWRKSMITWMCVVPVFSYCSWPRVNDVKLESSVQRQRRTSKHWMKDWYQRPSIGTYRNKGNGLFEPVQFTMCVHVWLTVWSTENCKVSLVPNFNRQRGTIIQ